MYMCAHACDAVQSCRFAFKVFGASQPGCGAIVQVITCKTYGQTKFGYGLGMLDTAQGLLRIEDISIQNINNKRLA